MEAKIQLAVKFGQSNINGIVYDSESLIELKQSEYIQSLLKDHHLFVRTYCIQNMYNMSNIIGYIKEWNDSDAVIEITNPKAIDFFSKTSIENYLLAMGYLGKYVNNHKFHIKKFIGSYLVNKDTHTVDVNLISSIWTNIWIIYYRNAQILKHKIIMDV